ncbi:MAG TPA: hypothetical protein PLN31_11120 [Azoarcus taiwanensis]|nr:hypothetical protein [Azoarcus taiwanensis]
MVIEFHREALRALARRHGVRSVKVFRSMARGKVNVPNDVDLLGETSPATSYG